MRDRLLIRLISGKLSAEDLDIQFPPSKLKLNGLVPLRGSQKSKVKSQKADFVGFSLLWNGSFISATLY
ncbi:hypothetical protein [Scytonema sp. HK-05]|uniref:hypothetical protein n=1 Tax=Scytonema sp. HK-05 TaxID=1137095 RepID=UPI000935AB4C|nr:hypothetical protein [Scytonema sp. HK-05]OKH51782.1 hypothetical protein NIES2130_33275 [Scytonema sp. HK-05]